MIKFLSLFFSRRTLVILFGFLILLDLGRSYYARIGYRNAIESWQPVPYEKINWPPGVDIHKSATLGEQVYAKKCAICHGIEGKGNGAAAVSMIPRPRDFTSGLYKYKSTPFGQPPTDGDLEKITREGLHASAMPYWKDLLSKEEIKAVVQTIKAMSPVFKQTTPRPIQIPTRTFPSTASVQRGKMLYKKQSCFACHGENLRASTTFTDQTGHPVHARDLTAPWTFRGGSEPKQIWLRLTTGLMPSPMPPYAQSMSDQERWDVVNYILSEARTPAWKKGGQLGGPGFDKDLRKRGEYIVHASMCGLCHTHTSQDLRYSGEKFYLAGGMAIPAYPHGTFISRNLTPDPKTGLGNWSPEEIAIAIREGKRKGPRLNTFVMPWGFFHPMEKEDALAIGHYLKSLPPVVNSVPSTLTFGVIETFFEKLQYSKSFPPLGNPKGLPYKYGNYGQTNSISPLWNWPQFVLIGAQWVSLLLFVFIFLVRSRRNYGQSLNLWLKKRALPYTVGGGLISLIVWIILAAPSIDVLPAEKVYEGIAKGLYRVSDQPMASRGQRLFETTCMLCHTPNGSGGAKISSVAFGTTWVRNLTSDLETGLGKWSDAEIMRAIRSGVSRKGRVMHWQAMLWDHASNLDEEDMRALISYLRLLPPIKKQIPDPYPPSSLDCDEYTFFLQNNFNPGCEKL